MLQYLPRLGKDIQIEGSLMQNAWMGSDFSNDDLMKSSSLTDDYNHSFQKAAHADEWNIRLVPRPAAAVIWKHIDARIRQSDGMPLEYRFYDQQNRLKKLQEFSSFEVMGGRKIPTLMKMTTLIKGNVQSTTYLKFVRIEFREALDSAIFSKANLKR